MFVLTCIVPRDVSTEFEEIRDGRFARELVVIGHWFLTR